MDVIGAVDRLLSGGAADGQRPLPDLDEARYARPFWAAALDERLVLQYCPDCDAHQYFPRPWCQRCAGDVEWREATGRGEVYSYTVVRRVVSNPAMADDVPYVTAYVELEEGPRMMTRLVDVDPAAVERGMPVAVTFERVGEGVALPVFRPR
jgi:uncharacterized OB-fold protein